MKWIYLFIGLAFAGLMMMFCGLALPEFTFPKVRVAGIFLFSLCTITLILLLRKEVSRDAKDAAAAGTEP